MPVDSTRASLIDAAVESAWDSWSQLGLSATGAAQPTQTAIDPEALLLFTLEAARHDPRLFDEVLDWLVRNEPLISVQRAGNLCADDVDRRLLAAALAWVAGHRPRARLRRPSANEVPAPVLLFHGLSEPNAADPTFLAHGFRRAPAGRSRKSSAPDFQADSAFALRLRRLFGVGARAEVVRALLTIDAARLSPAVIGRSAGFSSQNVREALAALIDGGVATAVRIGREQQFAVSRSDWSTLLGPLPTHRDWVQLLGPLRLIIRWLSGPDLDSLSPYLRASEARALVEPLLDDLRFAGVQVDDLEAARGEDYWASFVTLTERLLDAVTDRSG